MSVLRRALFAWSVALSIWAVLIGLFFSSLGAVHPVQAQDTKPTKAPLAAPTKQPVEPQPTKEQIPPTGVPPAKEPLLTAVPTKAPTSILTKTPWPTELPTKAALPTGQPTTPSGPPTLGVGYGQPALPTVTSEPFSPTAGTDPDRLPPATQSAQPEQSSRTLGQPMTTDNQPSAGAALLTGTVFEDANDNGQRDPDEVGLPGVAVSVETTTGIQTVVTDASGAYSLPAIAGATVHVIVPVGWSTRQPDHLPLGRAGDFPLRARSAGTPVPPAAITPLTMTQSVIDFAPLIALGLGLGVVMAIGFLRVARAVSTSNRALALLLVRMQRTSEKPIAFEATGLDHASDTRVLALLNQAGLDAAGRPLHIEHVLSVTAGDRPAITALGQDGRAAFVIFTPLEARTFQRAWRTGREASVGEVAFEQATAYPLDRRGEALAAGDATAYPLDALNSGLFVADDLAAAYTYLSAELPVSARTLPRTSRWTLFVVPLPKHNLAVRAGWRSRIGRRLRS